MKKTTLLLYFIFTGLLMSFTIKNETRQPMQSESYTGVWQGQFGDKFFIFKAWQDGNRIKGHYEIRANIDGIPGNVIAGSKIEYSPGKFLAEYAFRGTIGTDGLNGSINDFTIPGTYDEKPGFLRMKIIPDTCTGCPITATWKVTEETGLKFNDPEFFIPTDLVLTKISSSVLLD